MIFRKSFDYIHKKLHSKNKEHKTKEILSDAQKMTNSLFLNDEFYIADIESYNQCTETQCDFFKEGIIADKSVFSDEFCLNDFYFDSMNGTDFENFCAELLKRNGFSKIVLTKNSGDQGVDILATKDEIRYAIQCKKYSCPIGNTPVQEVNAGKTFYNCHVGVVVTTSEFTKGAIQLAKATNILLWDKTKLQYMIEKATCSAKNSYSI